MKKSRDQRLVIVGMGMNKGGGGIFDCPSSLGSDTTGSTGFGTAGISRPVWEEEDLGYGDEDLDDLDTPGGITGSPTLTTPQKGQIVKGPWTREEDEIVIQCVAKYGTKRWALVASHLKGRTGKQCRERWHNQLDPAIKRDAWTPEEDRILLEAHTKLGNRWAEIAKLIDGRPDNAVKNRWNSAMRRRLQRMGGDGPGDIYGMDGRRTSLDLQLDDFIDKSDANNTLRDDSRLSFAGNPNSAKRQRTLGEMENSPHTQRAPNSNMPRLMVGTNPAAVGVVPNALNLGGLLTGVGQPTITPAPGSLGHLPVPAQPVSQGNSNMQMAAPTQVCHEPQHAPQHHNAGNNQHHQAQQHHQNRSGTVQQQATAGASRQHDAGNMFGGDCDGSLFNDQLFHTDDLNVGGTHPSMNGFVEVGKMGGMASDPHHLFMRSPNAGIGSTVTSPKNPGGAGGGTVSGFSPTSFLFSNADKTGMDGKSPSMLDLGMPGDAGAIMDGGDIAGFFGSPPLGNGMLPSSSPGGFLGMSPGFKFGPISGAAQAGAAKASPMFGTRKGPVPPRLNLGKSPPEGQQQVDLFLPGGAVKDSRSPLSPSRKANGTTSMTNFFDTMEQQGSAKHATGAVGEVDHVPVSSFSILPPWSTTANDNSANAGTAVLDMMNAASPRTAFKKINTTVLSRINPFVDMLYCNGPDAATVVKPSSAHREFTVPHPPSQGASLPPAFCTVSFPCANGTQKSLSNNNNTNSPMGALKSKANRSVLSPQVESYQ